MPTPKLRKKSRRVQSRSRPRPRSRSRSKSRRVRPRSRRKPRVKTRSKPRSKRIRGGITKKTAALTLGVGAVGTGVAWTLKHGSEQARPEQARPEQARPEEARPELSYEYDVQSLISEIKHALQPKTETTQLITNKTELENALLNDNLDMFFEKCAETPLQETCNKVKTSPLNNRDLLERLKSVFYEEDLNYLLSEITEKVEGNKDAQETLNTLLSSVEDVKFNPSDFYRSLVWTLQLRLLKFPRFLDALDVPYNDFKVKKFLRDLYELSRSKE